MPITITPAGAGTFVGWGVPIQLQTDFIGPILDGSTWTLSIAAAV